MAPTSGQFEGTQPTPTCRGDWRWRRPFPPPASPLSALAVALLCLVITLSCQSAAAAVTAQRLDAFWKQHNTMTAARPSLPLVRWAVQPIWWANDDVQDPDTAIDLQPQLPVMQDVARYYVNMVSVVASGCLMSAYRNTH